MRILLSVLVYSTSSPVLDFNTVWSIVLAYRDNLDIHRAFSKQKETKRLILISIFSWKYLYTFLYSI